MRCRRRSTCGAADDARDVSNMPRRPRPAPTYAVIQSTSCKKNSVRCEDLGGLNKLPSLTCDSTARRCGTSTVVSQGRDTQAEGSLAASGAFNMHRYKEHALKVTICSQSLLPHEATKHVEGVNPGNQLQVPEAASSLLN
jgi:hypothetical protein